MKKIILFLTLVFFSNYMLSQGMWRKNEKEIIVNFENNIQAGQLESLKLTGDYYPDHAILYVTPEELLILDKLNIGYDIRIHDLNTHFEGFWETRDAYHTYTEIINIMDSLATEFPEICSKTVYGTSIEGRELSALKISDNVETDEAEAEVMFDGGIHGDEIGCAENLIRFARYLCLEYGNDPEITDLIDEREIWLYIMVNPDGRVHTVRYNSNGVDLNRDWGYMWDGWGNSPGAFSQPESKALRSCVFNNQFVIHTAYHSGTEYVSYPWSYRFNSCPDVDHIDYLAELYSNLSGYNYLPYGQGSNGMYAINGSTKDANYGIMGSVSWSMEISHDKQPHSSNIMMYYNYNVPSMLGMIEYSGYGLKGIVTDSTTGEPIPATIWVDDSWPVYTDPEVGDYHKYLVPGSYTVTVMANGYISKTVNNVDILSNEDIVEQDFELVPEYGHWVYKIMASQIEDNNHQDEGYTPGVIGAPDEVNYSLGKAGWIILDMYDEIPLGPIHELTVYEGDMSPESFYIAVADSMDGPWNNIGTYTGTAEVEIPDNLEGMRYVKITDDGDGYSQVDNAGYDLDAIGVTDQSNTVDLHAYHCIVIDTANGNGNYRIDPGETVAVKIPITNLGDYTAKNTYGLLKSDPFYIDIEEDSLYYGNINSGDTIFRSYIISASSSTPQGHKINLRLETDSYSGIFTEVFIFPEYVGQIPVGIIDLDLNKNSGIEMENCCKNMDINYQYTDTFPATFDQFDHLFVCLGTSDSNYILSEDEGAWLAEYLDNGGNLYLEGGNTWYDDPATPVHLYFGINSTGSGSDDLDTIHGVEATFTHDLEFIFTGDNQSIDHIQAEGTSYDIFGNYSPEYFIAIVNSNGIYKTIGSSFEFGGLENGNGSSNKDELFNRYLDYFAGVYTALPDLSTIENHSIQLNNYPNPFKRETTITYSLTDEGVVSIEIYNITGKKVSTLIEKHHKPGKYSIIWKAEDKNNNSLPDGVYFCALKSGKTIKTKTFIINSN